MVTEVSFSRCSSFFDSTTGMTSSTTSSTTFTSSVVAMPSELSSYVSCFFSAAVAWTSWSFTSSDLTSTSTSSDGDVVSISTTYPNDHELINLIPFPQSFQCLPSYLQPLPMKGVIQQESLYLLQVLLLSDPFHPESSSNAAFSAALSGASKNLSSSPLISQLKISFAKKGNLHLWEALQTTYLWPLLWEASSAGMTVMRSTRLFMRSWSKLSWFDVCDSHLLTN